MNDIEKLNTIAKLILGKKAADLVAIDLRELDYITDFILIATGFNEVHIQSITSNLLKDTKGTPIKPWHQEGMKQGSTWVCIDFGSVFVHIMSSKKRDYYDIEDLWVDAPRIDLEIVEEQD